MEMGHGFTPVRSIVDYNSKSFLEAFAVGYLASNKKQVANDFHVRFLSLLDTGDWFLGNHKSMSRSLRGHVPDSNADGVFVENFGWNFFCNDFFKYSSHFL